MGLFLRARGRPGSDNGKACSIVHDQHHHAMVNAEGHV
jgi:hypothetical protein